MDRALWCSRRACSPGSRVRAASKLAGYTKTRTGLIADPRPFSLSAAAKARLLFQSMELEPTARPLPPVHDPRPRLLEPLPVRLIAVEDVRLPAPAGVETKLDAFYVVLLGFER